MNEKPEQRVKAKLSHDEYDYEHREAPKRGPKLFYNKGEQK